MKNTIKLTNIHADNTDSIIRKMERLLFPFRDRLLIVASTSYQVTQILPIFSNLNRSIILVCNFCTERETINIPENVNIIDFSLIDREYYSQNINLYYRLLKPAGIIIIDESEYKERVWREQANYYNAKTLTLDLEIRNIIPLINCEFPYHLLDGYMTDKLFIGCDKYLIDGWLNTDLREGGEIKYLDISNELPFKEKEFQYIFIEDTLEYLDIDKCMNALSEIYRILKHGGHLRISILNIYFFVTLCLHPEKTVNKKYIKWFINNNNIENISNIKMEEIAIIIFDKYINKSKYLFFYDINTVKLLLEKCGFKKISYYTTGESNKSVFKNIEQQIFTYPMWINQIKFVSLEAVKL